mmetsp:Transcript_20806/g.46915  ORF Transcript_20806/g.46915 Transcript_20806/m.46915 type:complete len:184 (+) Transcript_20806:90-641(+)
MQAPLSPRARPSVGPSPQAKEDSSPGRKRPKHFQEVVALDVSAAAQLLAGLRHHLQSAATAARTEEAQRHATQELLRKTRAELSSAAGPAGGAGAGSERAGASLVSAAHAKLQSVLPSWLLRDAPEPEVEDPRIKELETKVEELRRGCCRRATPRPWEEAGRDRGSRGSLSLPRAASSGFRCR